MLKALEDITSTKKRLKIEIPADVIESEIRKGLSDVQKKAKIPGFRPGKTPIHLIEKKFGREVEADVLEKVIPDFYLKALKEADLTPVSRPVVEESMDYKRNEPLSMTVTVEVMPKVEPLKYDDITVSEVPVSVSEEDIENVLKSLAEERATYESTDEAVSTGDLITADYTVKDDGTSAKDMVLKVGSGPYPEEFFNGLLNRKKDEQFEVSARFPEDSPVPFAGKSVTLEIKIKEIKRRNIPQIDDEFAKDLGFESLEQLKARLRKNILTIKNREADRIKQREIMDALIETHKFDVPESLLNAELEGIIGSIRAEGKDQRTDEAIREEILPAAEKSVRSSILLELIGKKEGIVIGEEDIKEEIMNISSRFYVSPENVIKFYMAKDGSLDSLKRSVFEKKVLNFLLSKAKTDSIMEDK